MTGGGPIPAARRLPALLLLLASGCLAPNSGSPGSRPPRISGASGSGALTLAAAVLLPRADLLSAAIEKAGVGLRVGGSRGDLVLRHAVLDAGGAEAFLAAWEGPAPVLSPPATFSPADELSVDALARGEGFLLSLACVREADGALAFRAGLIARAPDHPLLPVIPGRIPAAAGGAVLVTAEARGDLVAALLLRVTAPGTAAPAPAPVRGHRFSAQGWALPGPELAELLATFPGAEPGDLLAFRVDPERGGRLRAFLDGRGQPVAAAGGPLSPAGGAEALFGDPVPGSRGSVLVRFVSEFRLADYSYRTSFRAANRPDLGGATALHGEGEPVLVVFREALSPVSSLAVLYRAEPVR